MTFNNSKDVADFIQHDLESRGIEVQRSFTHHNPKSAHVNLIEKATGKCHHIKFATEPFHAFKHYFGMVSIGDKGETLDENVLSALEDNDVLYFKVGQQIYDELLNLELSNRVNITTNQKVLEFWITKKNQPHILLDTLKLNTKQFLADGQYTFDISDIKTHVNYNELSIFTQRLFSDYKMFYKNQFSAILDVV